MPKFNALLLMGPTGSGKTPLGEELEKRGLFGKRALHFDFGENLRKVAKNLLPMELKDRELIQTILLEGRLLKPEEFYLAQRILNAFLESKQFQPEDLLILNGLPRNTFQATKLDSFIKVNHLVYLETDLATIQFRLRSDPAGDRLGREDDQEAYLEKKLAWFHRETLPLLEFYQGMNTQIIKLRVEPTDTGFSLYEKLLSLL